MVDEITLDSEYRNFSVLKTFDGRKSGKNFQS